MSTKPEKYTPEEYHTARIHGSYANAAHIARWLAGQFKPFDQGWMAAAERMESRAQTEEVTP